MLTAYDYPTARIARRGGHPAASSWAIRWARSSSATSPPCGSSMEEMLHHTQGRGRGARSGRSSSADMPFLSYGSPDEARRERRPLPARGRRQAVKVEGGVRSARIIETLVRAGIPVMGHIGWTPQAIYRWAADRVQGKDRDRARAAHRRRARGPGGGRLRGRAGARARAAGARRSRERLRIPTIGIGAGPGCSGQIQVSRTSWAWRRFIPRHARAVRATSGDDHRGGRGRVRGGRSRRATSRARRRPSAWTTRCWRTSWAAAPLGPRRTDGRSTLPLDRDL